MNSASGRKKTRRVETDDSPNSASERNSVFGFRRDSASRRVVGLPTGKSIGGSGVYS